MTNKKTSFLNGVKTKLIISMLSVSAIPLIIAIIVSYNTSTSKAMTDALKNLAANANYIETGFAAGITNSLAAIRTMANSKVLFNRALTRVSSSDTNFDVILYEGKWL